MGRAHAKPHLAIADFIATLCVCACIQAKAYTNRSRGEFKVAAHIEAAAADWRDRRSVSRAAVSTPPRVTREKGRARSGPIGERRIPHSGIYSAGCMASARSRDRDNAALRRGWCRLLFFCGSKPRG